jgi:hypothetical protein
MGLDISYHKLGKLLLSEEDFKALPAAERDAWYDRETAVHVFPDEDFPQHADGLAPGWYEAPSWQDREAHPTFRAGSYGGYNAWRNNLCRLARGMDARQFWDLSPAEQSGPFAELIHFSDCEGIIGPRTAAKLAADFDAWAERAEKALDEWDRRIYQNFRQAFHTAAAGGVVRFH